AWAVPQTSAKIAALSRVRSFAFVDMEAPFRRVLSSVQVVTATPNGQILQYLPGNDHCRGQWAVGRGGITGAIHCAGNRVGYVVQYEDAATGPDGPCVSRPAQRLNAPETLW